MTNISDFKNGDAIDLIADIIEPITNIMRDENIKKNFMSEDKRVYAIKQALKSHKSDILEILARLDGVEVKDLNYTPISLVTKCVQILSDKELTDFFSYVAETE